MKRGALLSLFLRAYKLCDPQFLDVELKFRKDSVLKKAGQIFYYPDQRPEPEHAFSQKHARVEARRKAAVANDAMKRDKNLQKMNATKKPLHFAVGDYVFLGKKDNKKEGNF